MNRTIKTPNAPASFSAYSQAVEVPAGARTLRVSGQVGVSTDGTLPANAEAQHEQAWINIFAILAAADMTKTDIVDVLAMVSDPAGVPIFRQVRDRMLEGHMACSTLLICGLASPDWKVEIAVTAAAQG
ncbi:RidA family protein [Sedimentitalea arenosa]|jgi:enamine deaminase RidA (YjgF/YER057c/UK114 family)|uniref:RidA family protein n=1 Tax=Sedimentitalea arenosa TaxID=2798803 RepID=A0A8J7IPH9_9RHOB|nr:RidA family protein [Arenibacterium arenosum]MBJ6371221.1 RidA family protein [Arenibacterium arenosum]